MTGAYQCLDPTSTEYLCGHLVNEGSGEDTICETCADFITLDDRTMIGDGHCDIALNVEGCHWDGGKRREGAFSCVCSKNFHVGFGTHKKREIELRQMNVPPYTCSNSFMACRVLPIHLEYTLLDPLPPRFSRL